MLQIRASPRFAFFYGDYVKRINNDNFLRFGKALAPLSSIEAGKKVGDVLFIIYEASSWLDWFLADKVVPLNVCKGPGWELSASLREITSLLNQENQDFTKPLEAAQVYTIKNNLINLRRFSVQSCRPPIHISFRRLEYIQHRI